MKFVIAFVAFIAVAIAGPISISDNNVGDIVNVGVGLNAVLSNSVNTNILTALLAMLNQQAVLINGSESAPFENQEQVALPESPVEDQLPVVDVLKNMLTPELISKIKEVKLTPETIERVKAVLKNLKNTKQ